MGYKTSNNTIKRMKNLWKNIDKGLEGIEFEEVQENGKERIEEPES